MQTWQTKALELEVSVLNHLGGFIRDHALGFFIGVICLLLALLAWVLSGALRSKGGNLTSYVRPTIVIHQTQSPQPPLEPVFDPFPPLLNQPEYSPDDD